MMMITCSIYLYCRSHDNTPVYVGQTDRDVKLRDREHLTQRRSKFDKTYTDRSVYTLQVLETYASDNEMDRAEWMDERERYYIAKHGTYKRYGGLNYTRGGQGVATLQRQREACRKKSFDWQLGKMLPLLRRVVDLGLDINVPQRGHKGHAWTKQLGQYQNGLRSGHTACPDEIRSLLDSHDFEWDRAEAVAQRRNKEMLSLLRRVVDLGLDVNVPFRGHKGHAWTKQLGKYQNSLRIGHTACPDDISAWLGDHGFEWGRAEAMARRRNEEMLSLLRRVVDTGLDINVPARGHKDHPWTKEIGKYQDHLRTGGIACPDEIREFLDTHGFFWHYKDLWKHFRGRYPDVAEMPGILPDDWVAEFQRAHAQHRQLCTTRRKAFGSKALSDEQVRARYT